MLHFYLINEIDYVPDHKARRTESSSSEDEKICKKSTKRGKLFNIKYSQLYSNSIIAGWSEEEVRKLRETFADQINKNIYPTGHEIKKIY